MVVSANHPAAAPGISAADLLLLPPFTCEYHPTT
jgi:hypothetical protein